VIKKKGGHGGHHGGAWKVAYADFVTAMMSLFIVLWLMGSSEKVKKAVAGYFNDPKGTASLLGTTMAGTGANVHQATQRRRMQKLKTKLEQEIKARRIWKSCPSKLRSRSRRRDCGLRLLEDKNGTFYQSGSARLSNSGQELLALLASELKTLPNSLLIEGHTDSTQYSTMANTATGSFRRIARTPRGACCSRTGCGTDQVTQVRGYADQMLRVKSNPYDPSNRRISILVKNGRDGAGAAKIVPEAFPCRGRRQSRGYERSGCAEGSKADAAAGCEAGRQDTPKTSGQARQATAGPSLPPTPAAKPGLLDRLRGCCRGKK
jgi:chemotaxis protein MotB